MTDKVDFQPIMIRGRSITFRMPNVVQLAVLQRVSKVAGAAASAMENLPKDHPDRNIAATRGLDAIVKALDVIEGMVFYEAEREWLSEQMLGGNLDLDEVLNAMTQLIPQDSKPKEPAKKARRVAG